MTDPTSLPDQPGNRRPVAVPRWVRLLVVMAAVVTLLLAFVMLATGGEHGPGRHSGLGQAPQPATANATGVSQVGG